MDISAYDRDHRGRNARSRDRDPPRVCSAHAGALPLGRDPVTRRGLADRIHEAGVRHERSILNRERRAAPHEGILLFLGGSGGLSRSGAFQDDREVGLDAPGGGRRAPKPHLLLDAPHRGHWQPWAALGQAFGCLGEPFPQSKMPLVVSVPKLLFTTPARSSGRQFSGVERQRAELLCVLLFQLVRLAIARSQLGPLLDAASRARKLVTGLGPSGALSRANNLFAFVQTIFGRKVTAQTFASEALRMAESQGDPPEQAYSLSVGTALALWRDEIDVGLQLGHQHITRHHTKLRAASYQLAQGDRVEVVVFRHGHHVRLVAGCGEGVLEFLGQCRPRLVVDDEVAHRIAFPPAWRVVVLGDFLEAELRRIRVSNQIRWARRLAAMTFFSAWLVGGIAGRFSSMVEDFGWATMATSGLIWCAAMFTMRFFRRRSA